MNIPIVVITENAEQGDDLEQDYNDIYQELRCYDAAEDRYKISLDKFRIIINSQIAKMTWSRYEHGDGKLTRAMKNELRVAMGKPLLPLTIVEAMEDVDPNAKVVKVGDEKPTIIVLTNSNDSFQVEKGEIKTNGLGDSRNRLVTLLHASPRLRKPIVRPFIPKEHDEARRRLGVSWKEVVNKGLEAIKKERQREV